MTYLSDRQLTILAYIRRYIAEKGFAPTLREIADSCQISSVSVVLHHVQVLEEKGRIFRKAKTSRAIALVEIPVDRLRPRRRPLTNTQRAFLVATRKAAAAKQAFYKSMENDEGQTLQDALLKLVDVCEQLAKEIAGQKG